MRKRWESSKVDPASLDERLLAAFIASRDDSAFEQIVNRHGPMVMGVCRRVLGNSPDADDVFQATFLVLIERAESLRCSGSLAAWLCRIAYRTALRTQTAARNRAKKLAMLIQELPRESTGPGNASLLARLDAALNELPEMDRAAIVMCDLEGRKHREVAAELSVPVSTISNRLARARGKLRRVLQRQGVVVGSTALAVELSSLASAGTLPSAMVQTTLCAASQVRDLGLAAQCVAPSSAKLLAKSVVANLVKTKLPVFLAIVVGTIGAVVLLPWPASEPATAARKLSRGDSQQVQVARIEPAELRIEAAMVPVQLRSVPLGEIRWNPSSNDSFETEEFSPPAGSLDVQP